MVTEVGTGFFDFKKSLDIFLRGLVAVVGVSFLGFEADLGVGLSVDSVANILSSCCVDIFSWPSIILVLVSTLLIPQLPDFQKTCHFIYKARNFF